MQKPDKMTEVMNAVRLTQQSSISRPRTLFRRKSSFEVHQCCTVDKIKRKLDKMHRQWEKNLQTKINGISPGKEKQLWFGSVSRLDSCSESKTETSPQIGECDCISHLPITVCSVQTINMGAHGTIGYSLQVDISPFVPDGSVTVRTEKDTVVIVGEGVCRQCTQSGQKIRKQKVTKNISLTNLGEGRIKVYPRENGMLYIDLV